MYIFNRMRQLYETSKPGTTEYILAQYILLNIRKAENFSVASISENTAISKSAVSKFIKSLSFDHGFTQFKSSLEFELQFIRLDYQTLIYDARSCKDADLIMGEEKYHFADFIQKEDVEKLARTLNQKKKIVFCGNDSKKNFFHQLINCLLFDGKDAKYVSWIYSDQQKQDLTMLDESSVLIIVDPDSNIYDFFLRLTMSVEVTPELSKIKTEKFYIGRPSKDKENFDTIGIETTRHVFIDDMILSYFTSQLLMTYLQLNVH